MTTASADYKRQVAERVTKMFYRVSIAAFVVVLLAFLLGLVVPLFLKEDEKVLAAKLIYSDTGILIGAFQIVLGILLSLVGLTTDYDIDASVGSAKVKLASASPGLLLIVCGNLLMGFSLMREISYKKIESEGQQAATQGVSPSVNRPDVKPLPPGGP
jgi:hypothetical protein